jgi:hypothetical protein
MIDFMKCVVEAVAANGIQGLMELVPGGPYAYKVGADAVRRYRERAAQNQLEDDVKEMIAAGADVALAAAQRAVEEAAPRLAPRERQLILQYVAAMPESARQSLKRPADPTGATAPPGFSIRQPQDVVKLLPQYPPRFVPGDWVPGRKDNWRLVRRIGGGGFGEVWLARHHFNPKEKPRAVKFCTDPASRNRLITYEKQVVARVMKHVGGHPNIVPLLECQLSGPTPWLMYEYVEGGTLADAIRGWHGLDPAARVRRALPVLRAIAGAVARGHAVEPAAVVHRDLKPANVLMAGAVPRITDYGIGGVAAAFQVAGEKAGGAPALQLPSMLSGSYSPVYASPQQRAGAPADPRDDVHALGVMAYQMFVGRVDVEVKGNWQKRLEADGVPSAVVDLIGRSASDEADDRPADAREWEQVLAARSGKRVKAALARPPRPGRGRDRGAAAAPGLPRWLGVNQLAVLAALGVLLLGVAALVWALQSGKKDSQPIPKETKNVNSFR